MRSLSPPPVRCTGLYLGPMRVLSIALCASSVTIAACAPGPMPVAQALNDPSNPHAAEAAVYACPMHPEVTATTPGACAKCGMTLVPKK